MQKNVRLAVLLCALQLLVVILLLLLGESQLKRNLQLAASSGINFTDLKVLSFVIGGKTNRNLKPVLLPDHLPGFEVVFGHFRLGRKESGSKPD